MCKGIRKYCWCAHDHLHTCEECGPELFRGPFVDVVSTGQCPRMGRWEVMFDNLVLLFSERFVRRHEPYELVTDIVSVDNVARRGTAYLVWLQAVQLSLDPGDSDVSLAAYGNPSALSNPQSFRRVYSHFL